MPNKEIYKEIYEMGERLMQLAKDAGYGENSEESEGEETMEDMMAPKQTPMPSDKKSIAMSLLKGV